MNNIYKYISIVLFCFSSLGTLAQNQKAIKFQLEIEEHIAFQLGDTIPIQLKARQTDACLKGIEKTRIFCKGLKIHHQSEWKELSQGVWEKQLIAIVKGNRKNDISITAFRKTDKGTFSETKEIIISNDN